jgi:hypothetical protein
MNQSVILREPRPSQVIVCASQKTLPHFSDKMIYAGIVVSVIVLVIPMLLSNTQHLFGFSSENTAYPP